MEYTECNQKLWFASFSGSPSRPFAVLISVLIKFFPFLKIAKCGHYHLADLYRNWTIRPPACLNLNIGERGSPVIKKHIVHKKREKWDRGIRGIEPHRFTIQPLSLNIDLYRFLDLLKQNVACTIWSRLWHQSGQSQNFGRHSHLDEIQINL